MKYLYSIFALGALMTLASCSKDDIDTYSEEQSAVRFMSDLVVSESTGAGSGYSSTDDMLYTNYSFIEEPLAESHEFDIPLTLIGKPSGTARTVSYEVTASSAPEGTYEITEAVIPADSIYGHIRVKMYNVAELNDSTYELTIKIRGNEQLAAGPKEYVTARLTWDNKIPTPTGNYRRVYNTLIKSPLSNYFSTSMTYYSPNALRAIVSALGDDWDDPTAHGYPASYQRVFANKYLPPYWLIASATFKNGFAAKVADWLANYEKEHGTKLLHDAGGLKGQPVEARSY